MMMDIFKVLMAFVAGYIVFISASYFLAKLMFPKVEVDEDYERHVAQYRKMRARASRIARTVRPEQFEKVYTEKAFSKRKLSQSF